MDFESPAFVFEPSAFGFELPAFDFTSPPFSPLGLPSFRRLDVHFFGQVEQGRLEPAQPVEFGVKGKNVAGLAAPLAVPEPGLRVEAE